ncbi:MAG TPA: UDP-3-O-acyl-N-acetylglucosamine deacetylase [Polyangiaceae bacterium]
MDSRVVVQGRGLHSGEPCTVVLLREPGPVALSQGDARAVLPELQVASTARATTVEAPGGRLRVGTVEHAFAALAGLGVREGIELRIDGPELPLLDGSALAWCEAVARLALPVRSPLLRVARTATYEVGPSRYELAPGQGTDVSVHVELDARFDPHARWVGDPQDFVARIAPARTFALAHEVEELARRGLARHADPSSVVVLAPDAVLSSGRPFTPDEPARHKLLDLIGDLYLRGGPPLGRFHAVRPGHASNARAIRRAIEDGALVPL